MKLYRKGNVAVIRYNSLSYLSGGYLVRGCKIIIHPKYNNQTGDNDIAIIKTPEPLVLGLINSGSICLPAKNSDPRAGKSLTAIGWGLTEVDGNLSVSLKTVNVRSVKRKNCKNIFLTITDNMICAGDFEDNSCSVGFNFVVAKIFHKLFI